MGSLLRLVITGLIQANLAHQVGERAGKWGKAGALVAVAGVFGLIAVCVLTASGWLALSRHMPPEQAGLIVAGVLIVIAVLLVVIGEQVVRRRQAKTPEPNPLDGIMKSLPEVLTALRPYATELITTAIVMALMAGRKRKRKDSDD